VRPEISIRFHFPAHVRRFRNMSPLTEDQLIVITGASGLIGCHLTHTILASYPTVRIRLLARPSSDLTAFTGRPNVEAVRISRWDDTEQLQDAFRQVDYVFNTAGAVVESTRRSGRWGFNRGSA